MCGICGFVADGSLRRAELERMSRALQHRGPDDEGFFFNGRVGLANRRLSIIDTVAGHQPIGNEDGSAQVVFNGEIYNYRELRVELQAAGHRFATQSDTEVLIHLYEEHGQGCVEKLRGMFAFAIWDLGRQELFLGRDRLGQKPLFYTEVEGGIAFASEIKALLELDRVRAEMDPGALHHYLSLRFVPPPNTMFRGIHKLPPGHVMTWTDGSLRSHRYWQLDFRQKTESEDGATLEILSGEMRQAVETHLVSDVPVGAFLSGGMDSSAIVAMMSEMQTEPVQTFAIGVEEQSFNELPYARTVADHCGTMHTENRVEANLITDLPIMIRHMDEPSDPIAACMYQASRLVAQHHVKVVLGGDGGDELFAGFDRYLGVRALERARRIPMGLRQAANSLSQHLPESFAYKSLTQKIRWVAAMAAQPDAARRYAQATVHTRFSHSQKGELLGADLWRLVANLDATEVLIEAYNEAPAIDPIDRMLYTDYTTRLPEHSLQLSDRMSMAHSLELRSPFLDHRLVEFGARLPSDLKIRRGTLKYALKKAMASHLPAEILDRPKQGFMFPIAFWFQQQLSGFLRAVFKQAWIVEQGVIRHEAVDRLIDEHHRGVSDHHVRLWMLLNLELWSRLYLEGDSVEVVGDDLQQLLSESGA